MKKIMFNKVFSVIACLIMLATAFMSSTARVFAESDDSVDGDLSLEEGASVYVQSEEDRLLLESKLKAMDLHMLSTAGDDLTDSLIFQEVTLSVPRYVQTTGYYCGPATVKEIIQFFNGSSQTQDYYANALGTTSQGTTMTVIPSYLTNAIGSDVNQYVYDNTWSTFDQWAARIKTAIDEGNPVVVDVNTSSGYASIPHTNTGHYLAVIGYRYNTQTQTITDVKVADPSTACNTAYANNNGNLWYTATDLFSANYAHWRRAIIW